MVANLSTSRAQNKQHPPPRATRELWGSPDERNFVLQVRSSEKKNIPLRVTSRFIIIPQTGGWVFETFSPILELASVIERRRRRNLLTVT